MCFIIISMTKVSIIIPVYNCAPYIDRCIRSIMMQTYKDIEIIAINDGSSDNSSNIIEALAAEDPRITLITQENQGVCIARNNGIAQATGDYLLFVDGDDYVDPDYIENLVTAAQKNNSDLVITGYKTEDFETGKYTETIPTSYTAGTDEMWAYRIMGVLARLYRRTFWDEHHFAFTLEKNVRAEDLPISLCANYLAKNIAIVKASGYHYIQHEGSAMTKFQGLKNFSFPKQAFEEVAEALKTSSDHNGRDFMVYGILKTFAQFSFNLAKGTDKQTKNELNDYFVKFIKNNAPDYRQCWRRAERGDLPFYIRVAVALFVLKVK